MSDKNKNIFDEWIEVDCLNCQHYWNDTCDGTSEGEKRPCISFLATRKVNIPKELKTLDKQILRLEKAFIVLLLFGIIGLVLEFIQHFG